MYQGFLIINEFIHREKENIIALLHYSKWRDSGIGRSVNLLGITLAPQMNKFLIKHI